MMKQQKYILLITFLILAISITVNSILSYKEAVKVFNLANQEELTNVLKLVNLQVNTEDMNALKSELSENSDLYKKNWDALRNAHVLINDKYKYVYTVYKKQNNFFFLVDSAEHKDLDNDGKDDHANLNIIYNDAPEGLKEAWFTGKVTFSKEPYTDAWGTFLSTFYPVKNSQGEIVYILALDQTVTQYEKNINFIKNKILLHFIFSFVLLIFLFLFLYLFLMFKKESKEQENIIVSTAKLIEIGTLSSMITHEINNPLSVINSSVELMRRKSSLDENGIKYLEKIEKSVKRIQETIVQVKNFVRNDNSTGEWVDLPTTLDDCLKFIKPKIAHVKINTYISNNVDKFKGNTSQFSQVILNLISNAVDAMEKEAEPWIDFHVSQQGQYIIFQIINGGKPLPPDIWELVQKGFYSTKEKGKGSGMGFMIIRKILETHKGKLEFDLHNGHTRFTISIPVNPK